MEKLKYLIRIPNHLGDTIMAQPSIREFARLHTGSGIALLLPEWSEPIFRDIDGVRLIFMPPDRLHGLRAILFQIKLLRKYEIETGILLTPSFSSALSFFLGGIKKRYGYAGDKRKMLLNYPFNLPAKKIIHRSQEFRLLFEHLSGTNFDLPYPSIIINNAKREEISEFLAKNGLNRNGKYLVIAPQAVAESRRWGSLNYKNVATRLLDNFKIEIALLGTAAEFPAGEEIAGNNDKIINLCGKTDIDQAASILSGARLFIGNDSGLAHLASAVNIPLVVLSGADEPAETSPLSTKKTLIIKNYLPCISCVKNRCPQKRDDYMKCMSEITVDEVFEAASKCLL
jgi:heptosyltransferase-2